MTCTTVEKVAKGTTAINEPAFFEDGVAIDFSAVTRMVFKFGDSGVEVDSDVTAGVIDWSLGDGVVQTKFGGIDINEGRYPTKVIAYDPQHPDGQMLAHESGPRLVYHFIDS